MTSPPTHRVLVVEDTPFNMELATDVLEAAGYSVLQAQDAEQAFAIARSEDPAVILMDVGLPGMDGLTAAGVLKADPRTRHIPVIAVTAHAMNGDRERAIAAGCDGYLAKPIDTRALASVVASFIPADVEKGSL